MLGKTLPAAKHYTKRVRSTNSTAAARRSPAWSAAMSILSDQLASNSLTRADIDLLSIACLTTFNVCPHIPDEETLRDLLGSTLAHRMRQKSDLQYRAFD